MNNLSSARGDEKTIQHIAAVLVAGYPNNKAGLSDLAEDSMYLATGSLHISGNDPQWKTTADFMRDATQVALWAQIPNKITKGSKVWNEKLGKYTYPNEDNGIVGKTPKEAIETLTPYKEIFNTPYAQALYKYGQQHFVDTQTAKAESVQIVDEFGKKIDNGNPLVMENGKSSIFSLKNYNGAIELSHLNGLQLCDATTNNIVKNNTIESGKKYYLRGKDTTSNLTVDGQYAALGESYFWEPDVEPYPQHQNLVYLSVINKKLSFPIVSKNQ